MALHTHTKAERKEIRKQKKDLFSETAKKDKKMQDKRILKKKIKSVNSTKGE